ncbi:MAG: hypothetical protein QMD12_03460 [Candidatus Aenigmarchaeota archaeon]|nr:hypothetical protein [Candidatus Aenigmarchaeota archaeon]
MSEQKNEFRITKGHILAGVGGLVLGVLGTLGFTKWLPEYQERVAKRQGAIMAEEFAKRTGYQYKNPGSESIDLYSMKNSLDAMSARLDDIERQLKDYKGANA